MSKRKTKKTTTTKAAQAEGDVLARITMGRLKAMRTARGGCAWTGVLHLDGRPWVAVENDGNGGCNSYWPVPGGAADMRAVRAWVDEVEQLAREATGQSYEALDALTSCMESGDTARQAVAVWASVMDAPY